MHKGVKGYAKVVHRTHRKIKKTRSWHYLEQTYFLVHASYVLLIYCLNHSDKLLDGVSRLHLSLPGLVIHEKKKEREREKNEREIDR